MTQEQKRIAIAEACDPWTTSNHEGSKYRSWTDYVERVYGAIHEVPDYFNDLNAMHEAEKMLTDAQYKEYCALLDEAGYDDRGIGYPNWSRSATAAQRAEAFGRTLGLWT